MRRIYNIPVSLFVFSLLNTPQAFANVLDAGVKQPAEKTFINADQSIGSIVSFFVSAIAVIAVLAALVFIIIGAFQWITSGGDKQKVESARNHIIAAIIGLVIVVLSFVIINIITTVLGIGPITNLKIPTLSQFGG